MSLVVVPFGALLLVLSLEILMIGFPLEELFALFLDTFVEILDLLLELALDLLHS